METPPVNGKKSLFNSITKTTLTPCRRLGLSRPSSGSLKKTRLVRTLSSPGEQSNGSCSLTVNKLNTVSDKTPVSICEDRLSVSLRETRPNAIQTNKSLKARRCLTVSPDVDSKTKPSNHESSKVLKQTNKDNIISSSVSKKIKLNENNFNDPKNTGGQPSDSVISKPSDIKITPETIEEMAQSIRKKKKTLEQLKVQDTYAKKHNLVELREQTTKWRTAGQEALRYSLSLAKQAGYSMTLKQLMSQHGFLPHLMGYNSEDDEFD